MKPRCQVPTCPDEAVGCGRLLCAKHSAMVPQRMYQDISRAAAQVKMARKPNMVRETFKRLTEAKKNAIAHVISLVEKQNEKVEA